MVCANLGISCCEFSFTGHVWITNPNWAVIIRMVHVMSIAVWLGALIYLALVIAWTTLYKITFDQKSFRKHFSIIAGISFILAFLSGELIVFYRQEIGCCLMWNPNGQTS